MREQRTSIIERAAEAAGRASGAFARGRQAALTQGQGQKSLPTINDETAWNSGRSWGAGVSAMSRPYAEKLDQVEQYASWIYICIKANGWGIASTPLRLYVKRGTGTKRFKTFPTRALAKPELAWLKTRQHAKAAILAGADIEEVTEHPFLDLMKNVNPYQNRTDLWESTTMFLDLTGEGYWLLEKDRLGVPVNIWVYPSQYMTVKFGETTKDLIKSYVYERGAVKQTFKPEDIVYFTLPNPNNPFTGHSIIRGVAEAVYVNYGLYKYETSLLDRRARPGGIVEQDATSNYAPETMDRLKNEFTEKHEGAAVTGRTLFLPKGIKFIRDAMTPEEIVAIESKKITREELCAAFDVPISALVATDVNRANAETADYRHAKNGIRPRCVRIEEKINERIMPIYDPKIFVAFDDCVPADKEFDLRKRQVDLLTGVSLINEVRSEDGKEARPYGDSVWLPMGLTPVNPDEDFNVEEEKPPVAPPSLPPAHPAEEEPEEEAEGSSETPAGEGGGEEGAGKSARRHLRRNPIIERLVNEVLEDLGK